MSLKQKDYKVVGRGYLISRIYELEEMVDENLLEVHYKVLDALSDEKYYNKRLNFHLGEAEKEINKLRKVIENSAILNVPKGKQ